jgi:hypothetical protein
MADDDDGFTGEHSRHPAILGDAGCRLYLASSDGQYGWPSLCVKLHRPSMSVA